ncbi:MAG: methionyl-tRNA formyltransferase [Candidatus Saccharibacteria bacterium]|nr:methionyl-tRNA formyltransferase [Candidatus Saccharibacteria bacterium]
MNKKISLVFFGSGPVAAESLRLLANTFDIEAIITKPTTEQEMGSAYGNAPIFTVSTKDELDKLIENTSFTSQVAVLIDFGIIVSQKVIDYFPYGIINSHFSILPELRGADPISFAILEGKKKTGVSLMLLVEAMDEGPILSVGTLDLDGSETTESLTNELVILSYNLLSDRLVEYLSGETDLVDQQILANKFDVRPSYTRKLTKLDGNIDWSKSAEQIEREIRAYSGWPKSKTTLNGVDCVITNASIINKSGKPGDYFIDNKSLYVFCGENALIIERLKPAGKKEMDIAGFLAGYRNRL